MPMGRVAIPTWNGRVSPVFDTASRLLLVDVKVNVECSRFETDISEAFVFGKTARLKELGVDTLICGAISGQLSHRIMIDGIKLIPWISGHVEDVLQAFLSKKLVDVEFMMPGHPDYWEKRPGRGYGRGRRSRRNDIHFQQDETERR